MATFERILVPVDFSTHSDEAIALAQSLANESLSSIHLLHVVPPIGVYAAPTEFSVPPGNPEEIAARSRQRLGDAVSKLESAGIRAGSTLVTDSRSVVESITQTAVHRGSDVIVMGSHGYSGLTVGLLGSVAERVVASATIPVITTKEGHTRALKKILVASDFSECAERALELAVSLASDWNSELQILSVIDLPSEYFGVATPENYRNRVNERVRAELGTAEASVKNAGLDVSVYSTSGKPWREIVQHARECECDLVAVGTRGLAGFEKLLLGSTTNKLLRYSPCPVLATHAST